MNFTNSTSNSKDLHTSFSSLEVIGKLGTSKATVYLVRSPVHQKNFAMKLFPYESQNVSYPYLIESRFRYLSHPNIIGVVHTQDKKLSVHQEKKFYSSFILMEVAPFGSFSRLSRVLKMNNDEMLARTYFHQLIEGLEYLHSCGVAHLDLKLENLLMGEDLNLKISDFDSSYKKGDSMVLSRGTKNFRAPELLGQDCDDPQAADIYSAGIILFIIVTGSFPYKEEGSDVSVELFNHLVQENPEFWEIHNKLSNNKFNWSPNFKELFLAMVKKDTVERATIQDIKRSRWYSGEIYSPEALREKVLPVLKQVEMNTF